MKVFRQGVAWLLFALGVGLYYVHDRMMVWSSLVQGEDAEGPWDETMSPPR